MAKIPAPVGAARGLPQSADHRKRLEGLRDRLASAIEGAADRELAPLAARYQSVLTELASLPVVEESNGLDDLSAARKRRRSAATGS